MTSLPQFPLGSVLLPAMVLPLHLFEPRYRKLIKDVLAGDQQFGVVLIDRGHEVGGDDQRNAVGTVAHVMEAEEFDDGRWFVVTVGVRRYRVTDWLPDDPYPMAEIEDWPDTPIHGDLAESMSAALASFERAMGLASEAGHDVGPVPTVSPDPEIGITQLAALAPVSQMDRYGFLCAPGPTERLALIRTALDEAIDKFRFQLGAD